MKTLPPDGQAHFDTWNELQDAKRVLAEVWQTLSDVCEFHDDPEYHLDVPAIRALMERIYVAKQVGRVTIPHPTPSACPNCGCVDQVNLNCSNHILIGEAK